MLIKSIFYTSGSQTGVRGSFGVRETIFWGLRSTFQINQHDAPEEKNFVYNTIFGQLVFPNQT